MDAEGGDAEDSESEVEEEAALRPEWKAETGEEAEEEDEAEMEVGAEEECNPEAARAAGEPEDAMPVVGPTASTPPRCSPTFQVRKPKNSSSRRSGLNIRGLSSTFGTGENDARPLQAAAYKRGIRNSCVQVQNCDY